MSINYKTLPREILGIFLFEKGPKDMPESVGLLKVTFFAYFLSGTLLLANDMSWLDATIQALIGTLLLGVFIYGVVSFFGVTRRFNQSMIAIYATGALITTLSLPYAFTMAALSQYEELSSIAGLVSAYIIFWRFLVMIKIIRDTIERELWVSMLLTVGYLFLSH